MSERVTRRELEAALIRMESRAITDGKGFRRDRDTLLKCARRVLDAKPASDGEMFNAMLAGQCTLIEAFRAGENYQRTALLDEEPPK